MPTSWTYQVQKHSHLFSVVYQLGLVCASYYKPLQTVWELLSYVCDVDIFKEYVK